MYLKLTILAFVLSTGTCSASSTIQLNDERGDADYLYSAGGGGPAVPLADLADMLQFEAASNRTGMSIKVKVADLQNDGLFQNQLAQASFVVRFAVPAFNESFSIQVSLGEGGWRANLEAGGGPAGELPLEVNQNQDTFSVTIARDVLHLPALGTKLELQRIVSVVYSPYPLGAVDEFEIPANSSLTILPERDFENQTSTPAQTHPARGSSGMAPVILVATILLVGLLRRKKD